MNVIIDRFEGIYAVLERPDGTTFNILKDSLPDSCKEGDCLILDKDFIVMEINGTDKRKNDIKKLFDDLLE